MRTQTARTALLLGFLALLALVCLVSVCVGARALPFSTVIEVLRERPDTDEATIIFDLRIPRTIIGIIVGVALGLAGALIQAVTRNPISDTELLGLNAGAGFAVVVAVGFLGITSFYGYVWFAFAGVLIAAVIVYSVGSLGRGGPTPLRLTLAGVALWAVLNGVGNTITLFDPQTFDRLRFWLAGTVSNRPLDLAVQVLPFIVAGVLVAFALARSLNAVALGEETARALGAHVGRTRLWGIVAITLLCGGATALAGPIGFVGLMIPHIARLIVGPEQRWILAYSAVLAPLLVVSADILGRIALPNGELPVSVVTAFLGAPALIVLVRRRRVSEL